MRDLIQGGKDIVALTDGGQIDVLCAADDAYAMPLAVTLKSACRKLAGGSRIRLFLLNGGITDANWGRLEETLAGQPIDLQNIEPDVERVRHLSISHHISHTAYFRLLAAEMLPAQVQRVIYLDADLRVMDDLAKLWQLPLGENACLAATDIACPYIDARRGCQNFRMSSPYMATSCPIRNYAQLGLNGAAHYFNSGVMVLNLEQWRREDAGQRLLRVLKDHPEFVWCWDQYALNVVFHEKWGEIPPRWNQGAHVFSYPSADHAPIDADVWRDMKDNPAIAHFTTEFKPWQAHSNYPFPEVFFEGLSDTAWSKTEVQSLTPSWRRWYHATSVEWIRRATVLSRKFSSAWAVQ